MRISKWKSYADPVNGCDYWHGFFGDGFLSESSKNGLLADVWRPVTDIYETKEAYIFKLELPGFKKEEIKVEFSGDTLTLRGERKQEEETKNDSCHRQERSYGVFERSFTVPKNVDAKKIEASLQEGILMLTIPKIEEAKDSAIPITIN
jgi:HSP20 family protein